MLLAGLASESVNQMCHFEGMVLQNLEKNNHSKNGARYFEEIQKTRIKIILKIGKFHYELTNVASQSLKIESVFSITKEV